MKPRQPSAPVGAAGQPVGGAAPVVQGFSPVEGQHYTSVQPPVAVAANTPILVIEFFRYDVLRCAALEPLLQAWVKQLPRDVAFRRVPIPTPAKVLEQVYYTLEAMGGVDRCQLATMRRAAGNPFTFTDAKATGAFFKSLGLDEAKFTNTWNTFAVQTKIQMAAKTAQAYPLLQGIPTIAVQGRYLASAGQGQPAGQPDSLNASRLLSVVDAVVDRVRKER